MVVLRERQPGHRGICEEETSQTSWGKTRVIRGGNGLGETLVLKFNRDQLIRDKIKGSVARDVVRIREGGRACGLR